MKQGPDSMIIMLWNNLMNTFDGRAFISMINNRMILEKYVK